MRSLQLRRRSGRVGTAVLLASPVVLITVVIIVLSALALSRLDNLTGSTADAGLARIGSDLALVIVAERGPDIAATRSLLVGWGIVLPGLALVAGMTAAWWVSGRVHAQVDTARLSVETADGERERRLQEIVHELRTPLTVMGTNLELAGYETTPDGTGYIAAARRAVGRMSRTVDDLAGHGRLAVEKGVGPIDLSELCESAADEQRGPGRAHGVAVRAVGAGRVPLEGVDPAAIRTALGNFMSNAIRLAPRGSEVLVDWGSVDEWAWVSVSDQGPGLAQEHHVRAFERGWQGAHDRDRRTGSGLGLTIARQLTEAQGGLITVESEEGGGATFALWLPLDPTADSDSIVDTDRVHPRLRPWVRSPSVV